MRRTTIALSAVTLAVTLGACSQGSSGSPESGDQSSSNTPHADVASLSSGASSTVEKKQTVTFSTKISGGNPAMSQAGNMECQVDIPKTSMSCSGGQMDMVITPDASYMKLPQLTQDQSKPWTKLSHDGNPLAQSMGQQTQSLQKMTDIKEMLPSGTEITNSSQEQVDGKDATRYETTTDVKKASAEAPEALKPVYKMYIDSGVTEMKQTLWVNSDDLPLKAETKQPPMTVMGQKIPEMTTTVTYKDWGKPVNIDVPPAEKVQEGLPTPQIPNMPDMPQPPN